MNRVNEIGCTIRPASASDARMLSDLALRSKAYWGYSSEFIEACRDELTYTPDQVESPEFTFMVAEMAGQVLGFYALKQMSASKHDLKALFVEPDHIGAGIGRALMTNAKDVAAQAGATHIVVQSDPHAQAFYERVGGVLDGEEESDSIPGRFLPTLLISLG